MNKILITGNEACAEGAIRAGCRFYAGYPITPQNELIAYMSKRMEEVSGVFIQSESELAAINMVYGGAAAGMRAMTSSSSPGVSLMQEGLSYIAGSELPAVIVNVQRGGPGLGNIAPAQSDYFQATKGGGHGDYRMITLAPMNAQEMFDFTYEAFDLADKYRVPVNILSDGLIGQMMEPMEMNKKMKTISPDDKKWALRGCAGREPNVVKSFFIKDGVLEEWNEALQKKYAKISKREVRYEEYKTKGADIVFAAYGSMARICKAVCDSLREEGIKAGLFRPISLWPFPTKELKKLAKGKTNFLVVEMSAGQMVEDVRLAVLDDKRVHFYGRMGGGVPQETDIINVVKRLFKSKVKSKKSKV